MSHITFPHLHVKQAGRITLSPSSRNLAPRNVDIAAMHLPTNQILLEDVVELLYREFDVRPTRDDWRQVLLENRETFLQERAW